jgi:hypothetical protein
MGTTGKIHGKVPAGIAKNDNVVIVGAPHPSVIRHSIVSEHPLREVAISDLVARADKFVTISNGTANIDPALKDEMSPTEAAAVAHMIEAYNSETARQFRASLQAGKVKLPRKVDPPADTSSSSQALGSAPPPSACTPNLSISYYWWGFRIHMDHCFVSLLKPFGTGIAAAAGTVATFMAAAGLSTSVNPYLGLAAGLIATMVGWITWADGYCTPNSGANYNQSWTVQGWITTNC